MPEHINPAMADEKLASDFGRALRDTTLPKGAVFFWMQAGHLNDTGIQYEVDDAKELFHKVDGLLDGE